MLPAFSFRHLRNIVPNFWEKSVTLLRVIEEDIRTKQMSDAEKQAGVVIEFTQWLNRATLDIIGSTGFGYEFNCMQHDDDSNELVTAYRNVFSGASRGQQLMRVIFQYLPEWMVRLVPSKKSKEAREAISLVKGMCTRMVREKKREFEMGGKVGQTGKFAMLCTLDDARLTKKNQKQTDILSIVTKDSPFTEEEMRDHLMTFLAAG